MTNPLCPTENPPLLPTPESGVRMRLKRVVSTVVVGVALVYGLSACSLIGKHVVSSDHSIRELQRESALYFRDEYQPNVEKVRFTQDGARPGLGASWRVNAIATVAGVDYHVIISAELGPSFVGGDGVPAEAPTPTPHLPLTVIYSDGTSEVIER